MAKPLEGLKVLDLTTALSGPFCTMMLADYGADVIKIEAPAGDQSRYWAPVHKASGESEYFAVFNRNKRDVCINLKDPEGVALFYDLVKEADILVENYRGGVTKKLSIDYESVKAVNPSIIYASLTGFGQTGPYAQHPCYDIVAQAMSGLMMLSGYPGQEPIKACPSIIDQVSGLYMMNGILLALHHRERTGEGQFVDVAMLDSAFSLMENYPSLVSMGHDAPERSGNRDASISPFDAFPCKDGYVVISAGTEKLWKAFCQAAGLEELLDDPRYADNQSRTDHYLSSLKEQITNWCMQRTKTEIETLLEDAGVPSSAVLTISESVRHPQILARDMVQKTSHPLIGEFETTGCVVKLSETPGEIKTPAPLLGQDNREILGLSEEEEQRLIEKGVLGKR